VVKECVFLWFIGKFSGLSCEKNDEIPEVSGQDLRQQKAVDAHASYGSGTEQPLK
jgi:hypothetical protein